MYKRQDCGQPAEGVLVDLGTAVTTPQKAALPIDFIKVIECNRGNLLPKISAPVYHDKFDLEIENNLQIPSSNEPIHVNSINIDTGKVNVVPVIPNFGNISVTNVLPANAKVICKLIPVVKKNIPVNNVGGNNATDAVTVKIASTIGNANLSNGVTNNNAQILPAGNIQDDKTENNANNALTDTGDAIDNTVGQTNNTVIEEVVSKCNEENGNTGMTQIITDAVNSKVLINTTQTISGVTTNTVPVNKGEIGKTGLNMTSANKISSPKVTENVQNVNTNQQNTSNVTPSNMYTVIQTSAGSYLIPLSLLQKTNTVNSITAPIISTGVTAANAIKVTVLNKNTIKVNRHSVSNNKHYLIPDDSHGELKDHCKCCIVLRKICKDKQKCITDYFISIKNKEKNCECTDRIYPKATKKLKLFLKNYQSNCWCVHKELQSKLKLIKQDMSEGRASKIESLEDEYSFDDIGK